jgi:hypothetical protein
LILTGLRLTDGTYPQQAKSDPNVTEMSQTCGLWCANHNTSLLCSGFHVDGDVATAGSLKRQKDGVLHAENYLNTAS